MNDNRTIQLAEIPIGGKDGIIWNRLHGEREDICEALIKASKPTADSHELEALLQARLRSIDDALDRLMSGSYGTCPNCGHLTEKTTLEVDPAWALCLDCSRAESSTGRLGRNGEQVNAGQSRSEIILDSLKPFDTILVQTHNSNYRMLLLDPTTGRALVEGGNYLLEPREGFVKGSALPRSAFNKGAICVGGRVEMWVDKNVFFTSPVTSVDVKHNAAAESSESIAEALDQSLA